MASNNVFASRPRHGRTSETGPRANGYGLLTASFAMFVAFPAAATSSVSLVPDDPRAGQRLFVRYRTQSLCEAHLDPAQTRIRMESNVIFIEFSMPHEPSGCTNVGIDALVEVGSLPEGRYAIDAGFASIEPYVSDVTRSDTRATHELSVAAKLSGGPSRDNSGIWWSPSEPGWALMLYQTSSDELIGGWLTHSERGDSVWYFSQPGSWVTRDVYEAPLMATMNGPYFGLPAAQPAPTVRRVGFIRYSLQGDGAVIGAKVVRTGRITYEVEGVTETRVIESDVRD